MLFSAVGYVFLPTAPLWANPTGGQVVGGSASIHHEGNQVTVNQTTDRLAVNWQSFNIAAGERTRFNMPSSTSVALNRVMSSDPTQIYGTLSANGIIMLINPSGIMVGPGGVINTASFVGSTLDVNVSEFMAGGSGASLHMSGDSQASIVNQGTITAEKGDVFLIAQKVENRGRLEAPQGTVAMVGSGAQTDVVLHEKGGLGFAVRVAQLKGDSATGSNRNLPDGEELLNEGEISAAQAELNASGNLYALAIKNSGSIRAKGVIAGVDGTVRLDGGLGDVMNTGRMIARNAGDDATAAGGKIDVMGQNITASPESIITAAGGEQGGNGGRVKIDSQDTTLVQGKVDVRAPSAGAKGGKVELLGERVGLLDGAKVDASGGAGGGTVLAGGDYLGGRAPKADLKDLAKQESEPVKNAKATVMADTAEIKADATVSGDGGKIIVWSDEYTGFFGELFARAGAEGGNGGFIETSSNENLQALGLANASSVHGKSGLWLLDPSSVDIAATSTGGSFDGGNPNVFVPDGSQNTATASAFAINNSLNLGTSVTILTTGGASGAGNITMSDPILKTTGGAASLTMVATGTLGTGSINLSKSVTSTSGALSVVLGAGTGGIILGADIATLNGNLSLQGAIAGVLTAATTTVTQSGGIITTGTGNLSIGATGLVQQTGGNMVVGGTATITTGGGQITLTRVANDFTGALSLNNTGGNAVAVTDANALILGLSTLAGGGALTVIAGNSISQTDAITAGAATFSVGSAGSDILLASAANNFSGSVGIGGTASNVRDFALRNTNVGAGAVTNLGNGTTTSLRDLTIAYNSAAYVLPTFTTVSSLRNIAVTAGGAITQAVGGLVQQVEGATASFTTGAFGIALGETANNFLGAVSLNNTGGATVTLTDATALVMGTSSLGTGTFAATSGGSITQTGAITKASGTSTFSVTAKGSDILLASAANDFGSSVGGVTIALGTASNVRDFALQNINAGAKAVANLGDSTVNLRDLTITYNNAGYELPAFTTGGALLNVTVVAGGAITQALGGIVQREGASSSFTTGNFGITLGDLANNFTGAVSLNNTGNAVVVRDVNALILGASSLGTGTFTATAGGNITQTGAITQATGAGNATFAVTAAGSDILLASAANNFSGTVVIGGTASNMRDFALRNINTGAGAVSNLGNATTTNLRDLTIVYDNFSYVIPSFTTVTSLRNIAVSASSGITQGGAIVSTGVLSLAALSADTDINLATAANNFSGAVTIAGAAGNVRDFGLRNINTLAGAVINLGNDTTTGLRNLTITYNNSAYEIPSFTSVSSLQNLAITTGGANGAITQAGAIIQGLPGSVTMVSTGTLGTITLNNAANDFKGVVSLSNTGANNVSILDVNSLNFGGANSVLGSGTLTVNALGIVQNSGSITQAANAGTAIFNAGAGQIGLTQTSNDFTGAVVLNNSGANNVTFADVNAINLGASTVGSGAFTVSAGGAITQSGAIIQSAGANAATFSTGAFDITLTQPANNFIGAVSLNNSGTKSASLRNANSVILAASTLGGGGALTVNADGSIYQTGPISAGNATFSVTVQGADILLASSANNFSGTVGISAGSDGYVRDFALRNISATASAVSNLGGGSSVALRDLTIIYDGAAYVIPSFLTSPNLRNISIFANGNITQNVVGGVVVAGTASFSSNSGNVTVANSANNFRGPVNVELSGTSDAILSDVDDILLGRIVMGTGAGSDLTVTFGRNPSSGVGLSMADPNVSPDFPLAVGRIQKTAGTGTLILRPTVASTDILLGINPGNANDMTFDIFNFGGNGAFVRDLYTRNINASASFGTALNTALGLTTNLRDLSIIFPNATYTLPAIAVPTLRDVEVFANTLSLTGGNITSRNGSIKLASTTAGTYATGIINTFAGGIEIKSDGDLTISGATIGGNTEGNISLLADADASGVGILAISAGSIGDGGNTAIYTLKGAALNITGTPVINQGLGTVVLTPSTLDANISLTGGATFNITADALSRIFTAGTVQIGSPTLSGSGATAGIQISNTSITKSSFGKLVFATSRAASVYAASSVSLNTAGIPIDFQSTVNLNGNNLLIDTTQGGAVPIGADVTFSRNVNGAISGALSGGGLTVVANGDNGLSLDGGNIIAVGPIGDALSLRSILLLGRDVTVSSITSRLAGAQGAGGTISLQASHDLVVNGNLNATGITVAAGVGLSGGSINLEAADAMTINNTLSANGGPGVASLTTQFAGGNAGSISLLPYNSSTTAQVTLAGRVENFGGNSSDSILPRGTDGLVQIAGRDIAIAENQQGRFLMQFDIQADRNLILAANPNFTTPSDSSGTVNFFMNVVTGNNANNPTSTADLVMNYGLSDPTGVFYMNAGSAISTLGGNISILREPNADPATPVVGGISVGQIYTTRDGLAGGNIVLDASSKGSLSAFLLNTAGGQPATGNATFLQYGLSGGNVTLTAKSVSLKNVVTTGSSSLATATAPATGGTGGGITVNASDITVVGNLDTSGGEGRGATGVATVGGGGGLIQLNGDVTLDSGSSDVSTITLTTLGGTGSLSNGSGGGIQINGSLTGTEATSNILSLVHGSGVVTIGQNSTDLITLEQLITAADTTQSTGKVSILGQIGGLATLTTQARPYDLEILGGGTISLLVSPKNTGYVKIGNATVATTFTEGLNSALGPYELQLLGTINAGSSSADPGIVAGKVVLFGDTVLNTSGGTLNLGTIDSSSTLPRALTLNAGSGSTTITGAIGASQPLGVITVNSSGGTLFAGAVTANSLNTAAISDVEFDNNLTLTGALSTLSGDILFKNVNFGSTTDPTFTQLISGNGIKNLSGTVTLSGGPINFGGNGDYTAIGMAGNVNLAAGSAYPVQLILSGPSVKTFAGSVTVNQFTQEAGSGNIIFGNSVVTQAAGTLPTASSFLAGVIFDGGSSFTAGSLTSFNTVTLASNPLTFTGTGGYVFNGVFNGGGFDLTLLGASSSQTSTKIFNGAVNNVGHITIQNTSGAVTFNDTVSAAGIDQLAQAATLTFADDVISSGNSRFQAKVVLGGGMSFATAATKTTTFDTTSIATMNGGLTLSGNGDVVFNSALAGGSYALNLTGGGGRTFNSTLAAGSLAQSVDAGLLTLNRNVTLGTGASSLVNALLNGITLTSGGALGILGGSAPSASVSSSGTTTITSTSGITLGVGNDLNSLSGTLTLGGPVSLGADVTLSGAGNLGNYVFSSPISGSGHSLFLSDAGSKIFRGNVADLASLTQADDTGTSTFYGDVTVSGNATMNSSVVLAGAGKNFRSTAGNLSFGTDGTDILTIGGQTSISTTSAGTVDVGGGMSLNAGLAIETGYAGLNAVSGASSNLALNVNGFGLGGAVGLGTGSMQLSALSAIPISLGDNPLGLNLSKADIAKITTSGGLFIRDQTGSGIDVYNLTASDTATITGPFRLQSIGGTVSFVGPSSLAKLGVLADNMLGINNVTFNEIAQMELINPSTDFDVSMSGPMAITGTVLMLNNKSFKLAASGNISNSGSITAENDVQLSSGGSFNSSGRITSANAVSITSAGNYSSSGGINSGNAVSITSAGNYSSSGGITSASALAITAGGVLNSSGGLSSGNGVAINAGSSVVTGRVSGGLGAVTMNGSGSVTINGNISSQNGVTINPRGGYFVNNAGAAPFDSATLASPNGVRLTTKDIYTPNLSTAYAQGLQVVFGVSDPSQLGKNQIGSLAGFTDGNFAPLFFEFATGSAQPYIFAQQSAVPLVRFPIGLNIAGAFPISPQYSAEEFEMLTPEERSDYEAQQRQQAERVILRGGGVGENSVRKPVTPVAPQASQESIPQRAKTPTAQVWLQGSPLASANIRNTSDSTRLLRVKSNRMFALRGETPSVDDLILSERMSAEIGVVAEPVAFKR